MPSLSLNRGLDHVALRTYDLDTTVRFYTEGLGFRFVHEWSGPAAALVHFAIRTDDADDLYRRALAHGAHPVMEPTIIDTIGAFPMKLTVAFVHGLDGEVIEFIERPDLP